jgi:uncharacterized membrane protein
MSILRARSKFAIFDGLHWLMTLLTISGMGVSAYLTWAYLTPSANLSCGGSHGCEAVKNSVYANLMGIPLPLIGLVSYFILLALLIFQSQFCARGSTGLSFIVLAIFGLSLSGVLYSAYLTYLELFVIYAICRWCVTSAVIMLVIFLLSTLNLRYATRHKMGN